VRARIAMRKIDGMDGAGDAPTLAVVVLWRGGAWSIDDIPGLLRLFRSWKARARQCWRAVSLPCIVPASGNQSGLGFACACWALEPLGTRSVTWQCNESRLETDQGKRRAGFVRPHARSARVHAMHRGCGCALYQLSRWIRFGGAEATRADACRTPELLVGD
jgi:hypothetical protein